ncbi:MAG: hypothetical protein K6G30_12235 [Acetatifactor sp.]|nr:hypothetical protein [Acetatifactor sp.]
MTEIDVKEIREAIEAADNALEHLRSARRYLDSASNWGLLDLFGGGLISGFMKHSKMSDAEHELDNARYALQRFSKELRDVSGYSSIHIGDFLTFADFFFDGFVADILVQSKISDGKRQCDEAIRRVEVIRGELRNKLRDN